jgi:ligand-binding SRPBCC domain-containing protein
MGIYLLRTQTTLPMDLRRVFAFFSDARHVDRITPPWLRFESKTQPPFGMRPGTLMEFRIRLHGVPMRWVTEITEWNPPHQFVDEQRHGPYRWWMHTHTFRPTEDGAGTEMEDTVHYNAPGGMMVHALLIGRDLRRIFRFRDRALREALQLPPAPRPPRITIERLAGPRDVS